MKTPFRRLARLFLLVLLFAPAAGSAQDPSAAPRPGYVNVRELAKSLGLTCKWSPLTKMVILARGTQIMRLVVDQNEAVLDNQPVELPGPPILQNGQVMIPARSIIQAFGGSPDGDSPQIEIEPPVVRPPPSQPPPPQILPESRVEEEEEEEEEGEPILQAVRHSKRDDQTRVVLEFTGPVSYRTEQVSPDKIKVRIDGCQNKIPTKRSNPVGRDLKAISFNSGADRKGLVVSFDLVEGGEMPVVETVNNPFRMVFAFKTPPGAVPATGTVPLKATDTTKLPGASETVSLPSKPGKTASATAKVTPPIATGTPPLPKGTESSSATGPVDIPPSVEPPEPVVEWKNVVELASLSRSIFAGYTVMIDAGHGGRDHGVKSKVLPPEKEITLAVAQKLKAALKSVGLNALLIRSGDQELSVAERHAIANRMNGNLLISLHLGGANDENIEGVGCFSYDSGGVGFDIDTGSRLSPQLVYNEWVQTYRFDLAKYLAGRVRDRLVKHLETRDRGIRPLPLVPLRFVTSAAILVEMGMLTNPSEGRKLALPAYQEAAARAIANGVLDFFNSLKLGE